MLTDHLYNLMTQLTQEHKSVWRMKKYYVKDAGDCVDCVKFWEKLAADKEAHIRVLEEEVKKHMARM
jgi:hypothetical protein